MQALAIANQIRCEGRRLRREMNALPTAQSRQRAVELLRDPPSEIARMRVGFFLMGIHRYGPQKAAEALRWAGLSGTWDYRIGPFERVSNIVRPLSESQRHRLADVLEGLS